MQGFEADLGPIDYKLQGSRPVIGHPIEFTTLFSWTPLNSVHTFTILGVGNGLGLAKCGRIQHRKHKTKEGSLN
jgi:hypothetical protein